MSQSIRILIADDHELFREGVRTLLSSIDGVMVVAEAATGEEVIAKALECRPHVILMDIQMPDINGIEATRRILEKQPECGVIVVTMFEDDDSVFAALRAGARGYILKGSGQAELRRAIAAVANGEAIYNAKIAARLLQFFKVSRRELPLNVFPDLTEREREVLDLVAQGLPNGSIARRFSISEKTVRNHVSNIFSKLQVTDRTQAVIRARKAGFGQNETG